MENKKEKKYPDRNHGRQHNQKMKPYLVMQYLMKYSDGDNALSAKNIVDYLKEDCGIYAERRSIYRDVDEINKAMLMKENDIDIDEATEWLENDKYDEEKFIVYDKNKKGFYVRRRHYDMYDISLLAECVYSAKFLDKTQAKRLAEIVYDHISEYQVEKIKHDAFLTDRIRTNNSAVIDNITKINEAMSKKIEGKPHIPQKISFKYLQHTISDIKKEVERRHGGKYVVSPFALIINDSNYYLLAFDDKKQKFIHYRVDRMKDVNPIGEPRDGEDEFLNIDLKTYTQRVFSMYSGKGKHVVLRFINPLLDTVIDRFGTKNAQYSRSDDSHFIVSVDIEISDQFFGWLLGFGKRVQIMLPTEVREEFAAYLDKIRELY